ncbi:MAG TPA: type IV pilus biogenesis/stability protein PilW [Casimicrobiaceae bacterium]|nr:type IV pilus biogenesis/stability protein PilW [Casimicrobiaceae bacterium]
MRLALLAAVLSVIAVPGCDTFSSKKDAPPAPAVVQPQQLPPIKQEEATPRYKAELRTELAAAYFERGQYDVALDELAEAVKFDPTYPKLYSIYGLVYTELGDNAKAEENFRRALDLAPSDSEIRGNWGWYLCTHGKPKESIGEFEAALRNPLYKSPEIALINAGKCSAQAGDTAAADQYFRRALAMRPGNPVAAYNLALLSYRAGKLDDARALMRFVMAQSAPPPEGLFLGMCVERKLGDKAAEASYVTQLKNRYPKSAEALAIEGPCE